MNRNSTDAESGNQVSPIQRLTAYDDNAFLPCNTYAITEGGETVLIDPGPITLFNDLSASLRKTVSFSSVIALVATQSTPDAFSSIDQWRSAGIDAPLHTHWWTAVTLRTAGYSLPVVPVHQHKNDPAPLPGIDFIIPPSMADAGLLMVLHRESGTLFSGDLFSSIAGPAETLPRRIRTFNRRILPRVEDVRTLLTFLASLPLKQICPHHGEPFALSDLTLESILLPEEPGSDTPRLFAQELENLRRENRELQYSIVLANDARIKDPVTEFYNETFLREVLPTLLSDESSVQVVLIRLDDDENALDASPAMEDQLMSTLAVEIVNAAVPGALNFRFRGRSCLMLLPDSDTAAAESAAKAVRGAVRESALFPQPVTVSLGYADAHTLRHYSGSAESTAEQLLSGAAIVLTRLRTEGPRAWIALVVDEGPTEYVRAETVLIVTADRLLSESLTTLLRARGVAARTVTNGIDALVFEKTVPSVVVADRAAPQLDALQIRQEYLSMNAMSSVPFVLITDYSSDLMTENSLALGIEHIFVRPVHLAHLAGLCNLLLKRKGG